LTGEPTVYCLFLVLERDKTGESKDKIDFEIEFWIEFYIYVAYIIYDSTFFIIYENQMTMLLISALSKMQPLYI